MNPLTRNFMIGVGRWLIGALAVCLFAAGPPAEAASSIEKMIMEQFLRFDPEYRAHHEAYDQRLVEVAAKMSVAEAEGRNIPCTQQLYLEAKWLHRATAHWDRLEDKLERVEASLEIHDQDFAHDQSPVDGFWGACHEEDFMRRAATLEGLARLENEDREPRFKIRPTGKMDTGKELIDYLQSLLISDIANTGVNNREELGSLMTTYALGIFKPRLRALLIDSIDMQRPEANMDMQTEAFRFFLSGAQDPLTGYWGAWYIFDGKIHKTADLSLTYHTIAYTKGRVERWPQILATTAAIEDEPYPYGWRHNGEYNNHNLYDVAKIYRYGWKHLAPGERPAVVSKLYSILEWSLENTVTPEGTFRFDPSFSNSLGAEYYFGISFFDVIGYWDESKRFWTDEDFGPEAMRLCCQIRRSLDEVGVSGWQAQSARSKIERNCGTCAALSGSGDGSGAAAPVQSPNGSRP